MDVIESNNVGSLLQGIFTKIKNAFWQKSEVTELSIDATPTASSNNLVKSGGVKSYVDGAIPTISTDIATDAASDAKTTSPKAVKTFVEGKGYGTYSKPSGGIPASDLASGVIPTVPTISTNVATDKADNTKAAGAKAVYDEVHPAVASSQPSGGFLPNVVYDLGTLTGTVTFSLASATDNTIANAYYWTFETGSTAPSPVNWPSGVTWAGGSAPTIGASKHYEIMIRNGYGTFIEI